MKRLGTVGLHKKNDVKLENLIAELKQNPNSRKGGALACFVGVVREDPVEQGSGTVKFLEYETYEELAISKLRDIRDEMLKREGIIDLSIHHIIDTVAVGEDSLFVVVLGQHRSHVFPVLKETVEKVKFEVPIWKKEFAEKKAYWVTAKGEAHSG